MREGLVHCGSDMSCIPDESYLTSVATQRCIGSAAPNPAELYQLDHSAAALFPVATQPQTACSLTL